MMEGAASTAPYAPSRPDGLPAGERAALWPLAGMLVVSSAMERDRSGPPPSVGLLAGRSCVSLYGWAPGSWAWRSTAPAPGRDAGGPLRILSG